MPRYYFHFIWPDDAVRDTKGVELEGFTAAYRHACGLVQQVRIRFSDADEDWWIEVSDGVGGKRTPFSRQMPHHRPCDGNRERPMSRPAS